MTQTSKTALPLTSPSRHSLLTVRSDLYEAIKHKHPLSDFKVQFNQHADLLKPVNKSSTSLDEARLFLMREIVLYHRQDLAFFVMNEGFPPPALSLAALLLISRQNFHGVERPTQDEWDERWAPMIQWITSFYSTDELQQAVDCIALNETSLDQDTLNGASGKTMLMLSHTPIMAKVFTDRGVDLEVKNRDGYTALGLAVKGAWSRPLIEHLLDAGALTASCHHRNSAAGIAYQNGLTAVEMWLSAYDRRQLMLQTSSGSTAPQPTKHGRL